MSAQSVIKLGVPTGNGLLFNARQARTVAAPSTHISVLNTQYRWPLPPSAASASFPSHPQDGPSSPLGSPQHLPRQHQHPARPVDPVGSISSSMSFGGAEASSSDVAIADDAGFWHALYKFTRPHTMIGTTISVISISLLALQGREITAAALTGLWQALSGALLMNISIVGTNQMFDVEIDKVNKPELPLASGEFSMQTAGIVVAVTTAASLLIGWLSNSQALMSTLAISLGLGIVYSTDLPFMRWKRSPLLAAICILAVRAFIVQLGFYYHMKFAIGSTQLVLTPSLMFTVSFMLFFSVVIAFFKDIPDVKGDDKAGVRTLSVRHGVDKMFWTCIGLLTVAYAGAVIFTLSQAYSLNAFTLKSAGSVAGHLVLASLLWFNALKVNTKRKAELVGYYMFVWKLFYAEYLLIPLLYVA